MGKPNAALAEVQFVDGFRAGLVIVPVEGSRLVDITYRSTDPKFAARVANGYADAYIEEVVEHKFLVSSEAADWLGEQLAEHRLLVEASEAALQRYREQNGVVIEDRENIVVQRLADLNTAVTQARTARLQQEALYNQTRAVDASSLESFPRVLSDSYVQELRAELSRFEREHEELAQTYGERHPEMIRIGSVVTSARVKLSNEIDRVVRSVQSEYEAAVANERSLTDAVQAQQRQALALDRRSMEFSVLVREAESNRQVYEGLLSRARETTISSDLRRTNVRIVDRAEIPSYPSAPRTQRDLAFAALGAMLLGVGLVSVRDPPALPGRHAEFDSSGIGMGKLPHVSRYASRKGSPHDELSQSKSLEVGMSVSRGVHPEVSEEGDLRVAAPASGTGAAGVGPAAGKRRGGRASVGRSRTYDGVDSAEVLGGAGDRVHQGQERDLHRSGVCRAVAQFCRAALLGSRLLRVHAGSG